MFGNDIHRFTALLIVTFACSVSSAQDAANERAKFFENEVRPLLVEHCIECHGPDKQNGDLRLDSLGDLLAGGESGAALVPGEPDESLLIEAVRYESLEMPPSKQLDDSQIEVLIRWVEMGAPWPGSDPNAPTPRKGQTFSDEDRQWWALQPVVSPPVPDFDDSSWTRNEIDRFILRDMLSAGLAPAPTADRVTLVRRLYFDVTGLPPSQEQVAAFLSDESPDAYERLVDRLLDSKQHGEHAARAWLDLVRYADSDGYRADGYRDNAWRYRDYVIDAFNDDKPYDRFVQEQIAADELFPEDPESQAALGYLRHGVYEWNNRDAPGQWKAILEDVTDTTADVFMGLGLQCAKCHNHKFDPLLQKDYFRLQAYFAPMMPENIVLARQDEVAKHDAAQTQWLKATQALRDEIASIEAPYRQTLKDTAINRFPDDIQSSVLKSVDDQLPYERQMSYLVMRQVGAEYGYLESKLTAGQKDRVLELKRQIAAFDKLRPQPLPVAMGVHDVGSQAPPTVLPKRVDEVVAPGVPSIIDDAPATIEAVDPGRETTGRRAALARWLTDPGNPLSTRVIVNRVWQSHFSRGLAINTSDFGTLGEPPTHPGLLDYLTDRFVKEGWSLKNVRRLILNSATYRQSTQHPRFVEYQSVDPSNRWYWRSDTKRLQAEQIRDAMLAASGKLQSRGGGPSVLADSPHRSIYARVMRNSPDELLDIFDLPLFFSSNASRNTTTTPVQSLLLINSDLMLGHARAMAKTISSESNDLESQVAIAWYRVFGRTATAEELLRSIEFIRDQTERLTKLQKVESSGSVIETAKLPYRDGQAVRFDNGKTNLELKVAPDDKLNVNDFTIETCFQLRSVDDGATVRMIVGKWDGDRNNPGWALSVTGKGSRRKPQTLAMQIVGRTTSGVVEEQAIFSDHQIQLNTPYYAAACVRLATEAHAGSVSFLLKDLSNDDEPLLSSEVETHIIGGFNNELPLTIGSVTGDRPRTFDGLIDDVRLVGETLAVKDLLYTTEQELRDTIGFWRFELDPGIFQNNASSSLSIEAQGEAIIRLEPAESALVDFCHALLNSNEFLYVN